MNFLKVRLEVLRKVCKVRTVVIAFSVLAVVLGTSILMADWVEDLDVDGTTSNQIIYTDPATGNVGIGIDDPSYNLTIKDEEPTIELNHTRGGTERQWLIRSASGINGGTLRLYFRLDGYDILNLTDEGRVGIGTCFPNYKFAIEDEEPTIELKHTRGGTNRQWLIRSASASTGQHIKLFFRLDGTDIMRLSREGLDVVGTTNSSLYKCSSDVRYKKNVNPYDNALEKVLGLRGVSYFWKTEEYKERNFSKDKQIGFVAQEVEKVIPELVYTDDKGFKTMSYDRLTAVIVEAIKELKAENDAKFTFLKKENTTLKQEIANLKQENSELKLRLAELDSITNRLATLEKSIGIAKIASR